MDYRIEKYNRFLKNYEPAWTGKQRSRHYIESNCDEDAIAKFRIEVAKCSKPMRLVRYTGGLGYNTRTEVIADNGVAVLDA